MDDATVENQPIFEDQNQSTPTRKYVFFGLILFGASTLVSLILIEGILRVLPSSVTNITVSDLRKIPDPDISHIFKPSVVGDNESACFSIKDISINSLGFRDTEWEAEYSDGVAFVGDSFLEAVEVDDAQHVTALSRQLLNIPVLNSGISSNGTIGQLEIYRKFVKERNPGVVVLFMFLNNDLRDNLCDFATTGNGAVTKACGSLTENGYQVNKNFSSLSLPVNADLKIFLRDNCYLCNLVHIALFKARAPQVDPVSDKPEIYENYYENWVESTGDEQVDELISNAWDITELSLVDFKEEVEEDGARLVVVSVPAFIETSGDWYNETLDIMSKDAVDQIQIDLAEERLRELMERNSIELVELRAPLKEYQEKYDLPYPYFSYRCDGHWNPLGHYVASSFLANYLVENEIVPTESELVENTLYFDHLELSPEEVLGSDGYEAIFEQSNGVYKP